LGLLHSAESAIAVLKILRRVRKKTFQPGHSYFRGEEWKIQAILLAMIADINGKIQLAFGLKSQFE